MIRFLFFIIIFLFSAAGHADRCLSAQATYEARVNLGFSALPMATAELFENVKDQCGDLNLERYHLELFQRHLQRRLPGELMFGYWTEDSLYAGAHLLEVARPFREKIYDLIRTELKNAQAAFENCLVLKGSATSLGLSAEDCKARKASLSRGVNYLLANHIVDVNYKYCINSAGSKVFELFGVDDCSTFEGFQKAVVNGQARLPLPPSSEFVNELPSDRDPESLANLL